MQALSNSIIKHIYTLMTCEKKILRLSEIPVINQKDKNNDLRKGSTNHPLFSSQSRVYIENLSLSVIIKKINQNYTLQGSSTPITSI